MSSIEIKYKASMCIRIRTAVGVISYLAYRLTILFRLMKHNFPIKNVQSIIVLILTAQCVPLSEGDSDWLQDCGTCHCNWNSGKKTVDCKNRTFSKIPTFLNTELQVIDLSNNQIPEIKRDEFYDATLQNLHKIYMKNCTIQELNRDAFKGLAVLFELDLSNNYVKILPVGIFSSLHKLRNLLMNYNEIEILESRLFENMKSLSRVEFKHNKIKRVEVDTFYNVEKLSLIYLESNQLSFLRKEIFENITRLKDLTLSSNPWNCTCELQPFREFSISRNLYTPPTDCAEPSHLRGKLWTEIPTEHFACQPKIIQPSTRSFVNSDKENVTILCRIRGVPRPDIFWLFNKRHMNANEPRIQIRTAMETTKKDYDHILVSELSITGVKSSDRGTYTCLAENRGGKDEVDILLAVEVDKMIPGVHDADDTSNLLLIICLIAITLLLLLIIIVLVLCWYCRKVRGYSKETNINENGLITSKKDKTQNGILEGSVIMEMQKSLLTEVNPVEKPPRRTEIESINDTDDVHDIKKTLLDESHLGGNDEETNSIALSDTTARSRTTFVDNGYGISLPPDLLSFPAQRVPQSPSLQSSMSNIPKDFRGIYGTSPLSSPVYQHVLGNVSNQPTSSSSCFNKGIYGTAPQQFRTLQHPKNRNMSSISTHSTNKNNQSPFIPAPVMYPSIIMKQGYMTIPRKPRVPSWTPSISSPLSEFQTTSPVQNPSIADTDISESSLVEPVYDNLGLRTTAKGNSILSLNKIGLNNGQNIKLISPTRYNMKNRPLPATPNNSNEHNNENNGPLCSNEKGYNSLSPNIIGNNTYTSGINTNNNNSGLKISNNGAIINDSVKYNSNCNIINKNLPNSNSITEFQGASKTYELLNELNDITLTSDTEPLYGTARTNTGATIVPSPNSSFHNGNKMLKIPPRPPPKPKKKISVTSGDGGSTSQLFQDEGEDGTEV